MCGIYTRLLLAFLCFVLLQRGPPESARAAVRRECTLELVDRWHITTGDDTTVSALACFASSLRVRICRVDHQPIRGPNGTRLGSLSHEAAPFEIALLISASLIFRRSREAELARTVGADVSPNLGALRLAVKELLLACSGRPRRPARWNGKGGCCCNPPCLTTRKSERAGRGASSREQVPRGCADVARLAGDAARGLFV